MDSLPVETPDHSQQESVPQDKNHLADKLRGATVMYAPAVLLDLFEGISVLLTALGKLPDPQRSRAARLLRPIAAVGVLAPWVYLLVVRPWHLRWGAADEEVRKRLPGDDLVPHPTLESNRTFSTESGPSGGADRSTRLSHAYTFRLTSTLACLGGPFFCWNRTRGVTHTSEMVDLDQTNDQHGSGRARRPRLESACRRTLNGQGLRGAHKPVERRLMNDISEEALKTIEESFGSRFVWHAAGEAEPHAEQLFASVFPESIEEVESLTRLAARHRIPLVARGAGTALYPGKAPRALTVRFDAMRDIRLPEGSEELWVEVEPGATWTVLEERLRERGMGPTVYPTSAPRSTVGGWLAENGLGVGSYEYGWLLQNVLSVEVVLAGGERDLIEGETLRHFIGSRGSMGFLVRARLATRRAAGDVPVGALFRNTEDLATAVLDLYRGGAPLWHLGFLSAAMARAKGLEDGHMLFGAYPEEREPWVGPALKRASESHRGRVVSREEAERFWERRFFPATPLGPTPTPGRAFIRGARLAETLAELERKLAGVAIQGTVARMGEVALLAFDPAKGSAGLVDLSASTDIELAQLAGRSWMPKQR
jgi:glycolate oxidase